MGKLIEIKVLDREDASGNTYLVKALSQWRAVRRVERALHLKASEIILSRVVGKEKIEQPKIWIAKKLYWLYLED